MKIKVIHKPSLSPKLFGVIEDDNNLHFYHIDKIMEIIPF